MKIYNMHQIEALRYFDTKYLEIGEKELKTKTFLIYLKKIVSKNSGLLFNKRRLTVSVVSEIVSSLKDTVNFILAERLSLKYLKLVF